MGSVSVLSRDLASTRAMVAKAALFVVIFALAGVMLVARVESGWLAAGLYGLGAWALARAYYFAFYVIERYCDPAYRYAGVWSAVVWVVRRRGSRVRGSPERAISRRE